MKKEGKFPFMPQEVYEELKVAFTDPEVIEEARKNYGTAQVTAAIRNARREFMTSDAPHHIKGKGGSRLFKEVDGPLMIPITEEDLDKYLAILKGEDERSNLDPRNLLEVDRIHRANDRNRRRRYGLKHEDDIDIKPDDDIHLAGLSLREEIKDWIVSNSEPLDLK